jgi:hypothetical protein
MKRCLLTILLGAAVVLLAGAGTSNGVVNKYVEDFTTTEHTDPVNTTAWWDTVSSELKLYPFVPTLAGSYDTPGGAGDVFVDGDHAFLADGVAGLQVINITDPTAPTLVGSYTTPDLAYGVYVDGDHAFVAADGAGLLVIDISDPTVPTLAGSYDTSGLSFDVFVSGNHAFVADGSSGLTVIDITFPTAPTLAGSYDTPSSATAVVVAGDYAFVADGGSGLQVVDISDPTAPTLAGSYDTPDYAYGLDIGGDHVFVADYATGLLVIDISDPTAPTLAGSYDTPGNARQVRVSGNRAYLADHLYGLQILDISDPAAPVSAGTYDTPATALGVDVAGEHAFVADGGSGLKVIDIADPVVPVLAGAYVTPIAAQQVFLSGDHAYVANYEDGLLVLDISDPTAPSSVGSYDTPDRAFEVYVSGDYAYVVNNESGLLVIDISDPTAPAQVGDYDTSDLAYSVDVSGDHAFVADGNAGLVVIDVTDPSNPTQIGTYDTSDFAGSVVVSGDHAFMTDRDDGLKVIDISDPTAPTLAGSYDASSNVQGVHIAGDYAFLAANYSGLLVIDISDPTAPTLVGSYDTSHQAKDVYVSGDYAFVADGNDGLHMINIEDPTAPTLAGTYDTPWSARDVVVSGDHAFVASTLGGLQVIQVFQGDFESTTGKGQSLALDESNDTILRAWLAPTQTDSVAWELSADGGANWQTVQPDASWNRFTTPGNDLLWRSTLTWMVTGDKPSVSYLTINWIYEYAVFNAIVDVPDDQGGWVRVHFTCSGLDFPDEVSLPIEDYGIWQRVDNPFLVAAVNAAPSSTTDKSLAGDPPVLTGAPVITYEGKTYVQSRPGLAAVSFPPGTWELVMSVPAVQRDDYFARVSTTADSSASGPGYSVYMITAHTTTPSIWYVSPPDSGYSVDNIAPGVPQAFFVAYNSGDGNDLSWDECPDEDFQYFRVYRSTIPDFAPAPGNLVHSTAAAGWNDDVEEGWRYYYKITAVDHSGNESDPSSNGTATAVDPPVALKSLALHQNTPNPFNPATTIAYDVPSDGVQVTITVYDVSGRLVRTLVDGRQTVGRKTITWEGQNDRGETAPTGIYFYRMIAGNYAESRKMVLVK